VAQKGLLSTPTKESPMPASDGHKTIALTFDDGPDPTFTPQVLSVLQTEGVKATFFEIGEEVLSHPGNTVQWGTT